MRAVLDKLLLCFCPPAASTGGRQKPCQARGHAISSGSGIMTGVPSERAPDAMRLLETNVHGPWDWCPGCPRLFLLSLPQALPGPGLAWPILGNKAKAGSLSASGLLATPHCTPASLTNRPPLASSCLRSLSRLLSFPVRPSASKKGREEGSKLKCGQEDQIRNFSGQ